MFLNFINTNKKERSILEDAFWFAKMELLPKHKNLEIEVKLEKDLGIDGAVIELDNREFEVSIKKGLSFEDLITCVFHEFKHIEQHIRKTYDVFGLDDTPYLERPYEKDAFKAQEKMLKKYKKSAFTG